MLAALRLCSGRQRQRWVGRDWSNAAKFYTSALAVGPDDFGTWVQLGHALKESGDLDAAADAYGKAEELDEANVDLKIQLGHFYKRIGKGDLALTYYKDALKLGSSDVHAAAFVNADALDQEALPDCKPARTGGQCRPDQGGCRARRGGS